MPGLTPAMKELYRMYDEFNTHFYAGRLPPVVITIQSQDGAHTGGRRRVKIYGWVVSRKVWIDNFQLRYELNIVAEYLNREIYEIAGTLLHEMVHIHSMEEGIKDTSNAGRYHNRLFKQIAESHGLECYKKAPVIGWSLTRITRETREFISTLRVNETAFNIYRKGHFLMESTTPIPPLDPQDPDQTNVERGKDEPKGRLKKWVCPVCGRIVRAAGDLNILCGVDMERFIQSGN